MINWMQESIMSETKMAKVTISIPQRLLEYADQLAERQETTRSGVISKLLEKEETDELHALMVEGYKEMAAENQRLAGEAWPLASETMRHHTIWEEGPGGQEG
jgi:metal-responsive CopG/Arc/MetJ family transcriptional regulator